MSITPILTTEAKYVAHAATQAGQAGGLGHWVQKAADEFVHSDAAQNFGVACRNWFPALIAAKSFSPLARIFDQMFQDKREHEFESKTGIPLPNFTPKTLQVAKREAISFATLGVTGLLVNWLAFPKLNAHFEELLDKNLTKLAEKLNHAPEIAQKRAMRAAENAHQWRVAFLLGGLNGLTVLLGEVIARVGAYRSKDGQDPLKEAIDQFKNKVLVTKAPANAPAFSSIGEQAPTPLSAGLFSKRTVGLPTLPTNGVAAKTNPFVTAALS